MERVICDRCGKGEVDTIKRVFTLIYSVIPDVDDEIFLCKKCYRTFESMVDTFLETEEVRS